MDENKWKYKIGSGKLPMIVSLLMLAVFGGLTIWLYRTQKGAFLFTGVLSAVMLLLLVATVHRFLCYKVLIGKDSFYYQTRLKNGRYYEYQEIEKAWISSGTAQNGAQEEYCNIEVSGEDVIRFQFFYNDKKGVRYLIKRVGAVGGSGKESRLSDSGEYGKTRKFLFEKPVHEREVNVLKERIEKARAKTELENG